MKNAMYLVAGIVLIMMTTACQKETTAPTETKAQSGLWVTPNGYTIPYAQKDHWKQYLKENLDQEKESGKRYKSQNCVLSNSNCNLECVPTTERNSDCVKATPCAPCYNCGCTPTTPR